MQRADTWPALAAQIGSVPRCVCSSRPPAQTAWLSAGMSVCGQNYFLERSTGLSTLSVFVPFASNVVGQAETTILVDTKAPGSVPFFYRVGLSE
jgi:hypothetical protein